jgi:predicted aspartyl protease
MNCSTERGELLVDVYMWTVAIDHVHTGTFVLSLTAVENEVFMLSFFCRKSS